MKRITYSCSRLLLIFALEGWRSLLAQQPVLETYSINHGGNQSTKLSGVDAELSDKFFGGGTTRAHIRFVAEDVSGSLSLLVFRTVEPGQTVFALLVNRIEVRGYDAAGGQVYARDLNGFVFGDSQPGIWSQELEDLPVTAQQIKIAFFGNYE